MRSRAGLSFPSGPSLAPSCLWSASQGTLCCSHHLQVLDAAVSGTNGLVRSGQDSPQASDLRPTLQPCSYRPTLPGADLGMVPTEWSLGSPRSARAPLGGSPQAPRRDGGTGWQPPLLADAPLPLPLPAQGQTGNIPAPFMRRTTPFRGAPAGSRDPLALPQAGGECPVKGSRAGSDDPQEGSLRRSHVPHDVGPLSTVTSAVPRSQQENVLLPVCLETLSSKASKPWSLRVPAFLSGVILILPGGTVNPTLCKL